MIQKRKHAFEQGFTLVEMAIVILILGLVLGSVFGFMGTQLEQKKYQITLERQKKVASALASFAQVQGQLPCPARQDDATATFGEAPTNCASDALRDGIIPFRTIGIPREDIIDGYGNPFTYAISEAVRSDPTSGNVHTNCRVGAWVISGANVNPRKARFCCRSITPAQQIRVFSDRNASNLILLPQNGTDFQDMNTSAAISNTDRLAYMAYVLISHGPDGLRSYTLPQGTTVFSTRKTVGSSAAGSAETINGDNNRDYVAMPRSTASGAEHFDDVVLWRTQEAVISELNNDSCARP